MSCVEGGKLPRQPRRAKPGRSGRAGLAAPLLLALLGGGCSEAPAPGSTATSATRAPAAVPAGGTTVPTDRQPPAAPPRQSAGDDSGLADDWDDYRRRAALRIVALSRASTYDGPAPEPLLAIPVLEIALNADGSVRDVHVLRRPGQAQDTVQIAIAAVRRAAPFGRVSHLPRPWTFTEVFLFDHARRFKPRSLDAG